VTFLGDDSLRINPTERREHANNSHDINDLERMTQFSVVLAIVRIFLKRIFLRASPTFSTISGFGIEFAPLASGLPNQKVFRISKLASIWQFAG
jgi:hypothetical protein